MPKMIEKRVDRTGKISSFNPDALPETFSLRVLDPVSGETLNKQYKSRSQRERYRERYRDQGYKVSRI